MDPDLSIGLRDDVPVYTHQTHAVGLSTRVDTPFSPKETLNKLGWAAIYGQQRNLDNCYYDGGKEVDAH